MTGECELQSMLRARNALESLGSSKATKTSANDYNMWNTITHLRFQTGGNRQTDSASR